MASIGIRLTEDRKDFWFFGVTEDGETTSSYLGVEGLHRLLGELRTRQIRLVQQFLGSKEVREALWDISLEHWLVIDIDADPERRLAFASREKLVNESRFKTVAEVRAAIAEPVKPRSP